MRKLLVGVVVGVGVAVGLGMGAETWSAPAAPVGGQPPPTFRVGEPLRGLVLPVPPAVLDQLRSSDWAGAQSGLRTMSLDQLPGSQKSDWAFLIAWSAIHTDHAETAVDILPLLDGAVNVPEAWLALSRGEVLLAAGKPLDALAWLNKVGDSSAIAPRGALRAADALAALGRTAEARQSLEKVAAHGDPQATPEVLLRLAQLHGFGSPEAYPLLLRIWTQYPGTPTELTARAELAKYPTPPTWQDHAKRGEQLLKNGDFAGTSQEVEPYVAQASGDTLDTCRILFLRGAALYRRNAVSDAAAALANIGQACKNVSGEPPTNYGARGLYTLGLALYKRKQFDASAAAFRQLVDLFPTSTFGDDALTKGGLASFEAGKLDDARKWWEEALQKYPDGDTVPEALLRVAMSQYLAGDAAGARATAKKLGALPLAGDQVNVPAGRYWAARWRLYGDPANPAKKSADPAAVADAVAEWKALCLDLPHSFYAILAWSRLQEVAPDVAKSLSTRPAGFQDGSKRDDWAVRWELARDPHIRDGVALFRLGLSNDAMSELALTDLGGLQPDERAWLTELRIASGDWLFAHEEMRRWLNTHPLPSLGAHQAQIIRLAYPDRYWDEVKKAVKPEFRFEPRLFHALVREESSFDKNIVSFAGAYGLSQLMPGTAKQAAGWLGMTVSNQDLFVPATNLPIGAKYLDSLFRQLAGSPFLAVASYNGGASNVNKWVTEDSNPPTDEYVERIPFDETRGYVKRVMGSWQIMRYQFDAGSTPYPDLSAFNHHARPEAAAP